MSAARRWSLYRCLLRILPRDLREQWGGEMEAAFADRLDACGSSTFRRGRAWVLAVVDVLTQAVTARLGRRTGAQGSTVRESVASQTFDDLRFAWRTMRRSPGVNFVAVATIALGIGGTTALFGFADDVLLRPLSVDAPDELVFIRAVRSDGVAGAPPYPSFEHLRQSSQMFEGMAAYAVDQLPVIVEGQPEQAVVQIASVGYFDLLGVRAAIGRTFAASDAQLDPAVTILTYDYWQRRFGGSPSALGTTIEYGGRDVTIVGVAEPGFRGLDVGYPIDLTIPINTATGRVRDEAARWFSAIGRLGPGVAVEAAGEETKALLHALSSEWQSVQLPSATHGQGRLRSSLARPIALLAALMAGVLVIACANIANLLLSRGAARKRELASRAALGASRSRIVRQLVTETVLLFLLGTAAGAGLASGILHLLADFMAIGRIPIVLELSLDVRALLFAMSLCLAAGIFSGVVPALRVSREALFTELRSRGPKDSGRAVSRRLMVLQVAAAAIVLVDGSLLVKTLWNLRSFDPGFRSEDVLTLSVTPLDARSPADLDRLWGDVVADVETLPGIEAASLSVLTPLSGRDRSRVMVVEGRTDEFEPRLNYVTPAYFETFGVSVRDGRTFTTDDGPTGRKVAILSDAAARLYFAGSDPVGARLLVDSAGMDVAYDVVGVVGDVKHRALREDSPPFLYLPLAQALDHPGRLTLSVRVGSSTDPLSILPGLRARIAEADDRTLVSDVMTQTEQRDQAMLRERLLAALATGFAGVGLLMSALGLYGLASHAVTRRTNEIGVRIALGARTSTIHALMIRDTLSMVVAGAFTGLPIAILGAQLMRSLLFDVSPTDLSTIVACVLLLAGIASVAAFLPARRAASIDPVRTLGAG